MIEQSESPVILKQDKPMGFTDAISKVIGGGKIHKLEWADKGYYGFLQGNKLCLHKPDGSVADWIINDGDLMGKDWVIL